MCKCRRRLVRRHSCDKEGGVCSTGDAPSSAALTKTAVPAAFATRASAARVRRRRHLLRRRPWWYCASPREGCCGVFGDWCEPVTITEGNLNGSCCEGLRCCVDDKTKGATCAECCWDEDCPEDWVCCGGYAPSAATTRAASEASASKGSASSVAITGIATRVKFAAKDSARGRMLREP